MDRINEGLAEEIEKMKIELYDLLDKFPDNCDKIQKMSEQIDKLIVHYYSGQEFHKPNP